MDHYSDADEDALVADGAILAVPGGPTTEIAVETDYWGIIRHGRSLPLTSGPSLVSTAPRAIVSAVGAHGNNATQVQR
jgi:hypothetical protein